MTYTESNHTGHADVECRSASLRTGSSRTSGRAGREPAGTSPACARLVLGGVLVDLAGHSSVLAAVEGRVRLHRASPGAHRPLGVGSVNLDHVHHFGSAGAQRPLGRRDVDWLMLLDGAPLALRARQLTGRHWPRLAGSDMLEPLLVQAAASGHRVGFLGGWENTHRALHRLLALRLPSLQVAGFWRPSRFEVLDPGRSHRLAAQIAEQRVDILVVGLGKPRQEAWIERHAVTAGAPVLLAFGAAQEFLAGTSQRAPVWMRHTGLEWSYRLAREPRRLSRRYCLEGPRALARVWRDPAGSGLTRGGSTRSGRGPSARW